MGNDTVDDDRDVVDDTPRPWQWTLDDMTNVANHSPVIKVITEGLKPQHSTDSTDAVGGHVGTFNEYLDGLCSNEDGRDRVSMYTCIRDLSRNNAQVWTG